MDNDPFDEADRELAVREVLDEKWESVEGQIGHQIGYMVLKPRARMVRLGRSDTNKSTVDWR